MCGERKRRLPAFMTDKQPSAVPSTKHPRMTSVTNRMKRKTTKRKHENHSSKEVAEMKDVRSKDDDKRYSDDKRDGSGIGGDSQNTRLYVDNPMKPTFGSRWPTDSSRAAQSTIRASPYSI